MTDRRGESGFSVAPRPLGGGPGDRGPRRARRIGVAIVVVAAAAIVAIAGLGPRLTDRPAFDLSFFATPRPVATPSPSDTPEPTIAGPLRPTTLPEITLTDGATPSGQVAMVFDGMRVLDLATGHVQDAIGSTYGRDAIVRAPGGDGWICICFIDDLDGAPVEVVRRIDIDPSGLETAETDIATVPGGAPNEFGVADPTYDVDLADDGRSGLLASAKRDGDAWRFSVAEVDLAGSRLGPAVELGTEDVPAGTLPPSPSTQPSGEPPPPIRHPLEAFVDGPHVRIAPGGRVAFVWGVLQRSFDDGSVLSKSRGWRVALAADGSIGEVGTAPAFVDLPIGCSFVSFAAADRLAWLCPRFDIDPSITPTAWTVGTVDLAGLAAGSVEIPLDPDVYLGEPLFDRANGQIYAWEATKLTLIRIDAHSLDVATMTYDPAATAGPGTIASDGAAPPDWRDAESAVQQFPFSQIAGSADGTRLFAVGIDRAAAPDATFPASLGILVLDRSTLALLGRWAPAANYLSVAVDPHGQVLASGFPGVDAKGVEAPWQASLTVHDPADGRILVRYGRLGVNTAPVIIVR